MSLQTLMTGLDLGSKFLTNQTAYFLGLLTANEGITVRDNFYWLAPVRHNPTHYTNEDLEEHFNFVRQIATFLKKDGVTHMTDFFRGQGVIFPKFNAGKKGFVTLFKQNVEGYNLDMLISDIREPLLKSPSNTIRSFLVGAFDGRASYDKTANFVALDYDIDGIRGLIEQCFDKLEIEANINALPTARVRKESNSAPRKRQIRVKHLIYLKKIGFISPTRFKKSLANESPSTYLVVKSDEILPGLKSIRSV